MDVHPIKNGIYRYWSIAMCSGREMKMWLHPECVGMKRWNECLLAVFWKRWISPTLCEPIFTNKHVDLTTQISPWGTFCQTDKMRRYSPHPGEGDHLGLPNLHPSLVFSCCALWVALFIKWGFNEDLHHQISSFPYLNTCLVFMKGELHFFWNAMINVEGFHLGTDWRLGTAGGSIMASWWGRNLWPVKFDETDKIACSTSTTNSNYRGFSHCHWYHPNHSKFTRNVAILLCRNFHDFTWSPQGGVYADADVICVSAAAEDQTAKGIPRLGNRENFPSGAFSASWCVACEVHETQCKMNWKETMMDMMGWGIWSDYMSWYDDGEMIWNDQEGDDDGKFIGLYKGNSLL